MDELELVRQATTQATAYSFRFKWGWSIFTLNDATGELSIHSDWGTYGHRWHTGALGEGHTLHTFLAQCDGDYVARKLKLATNSRDLEEEVCEDKTLRELKREICENRREQFIDKQRARDLWDDAETWCQDRTLDYHSCPEGLADYLDHNQWERIQRRPSARFLFIREKLWPFFTKWLSENVVNPARSEVAHG